MPCPNLKLDCSYENCLQFGTFLNCFVLRLKIYALKRYEGKITVWHALEFSIAEDDVVVQV